MFFPLPSMATKAFIFLLSFFLLFTSEVSSDDENAVFPVPSQAPAQVPSLAPIIEPAPSLPPSVPTPLPTPAVDTKDCPSLCDTRCKLHSRPGLCKRACATCCVRCRCVPPGTSGNRELCGSCYADMTTHGNRTKCP